MTPKQQQVLAVLGELDYHPTVRSLADLMETRYHRSERWSDREVRGLLERLHDQGLVSKYKSQNGAVRYQPTDAA